MREFPRTGRRITRSSELSTSRESPGLNWSSSRTGLGSTIRPVLSIVTAVTIMAFYHRIWHLRAYLDCILLAQRSPDYVGMWGESAAKLQCHACPDPPAV